MGEFGGGIITRHTRQMKVARIESAVIFLLPVDPLDGEAEAMAANAATNQREGSRGRPFQRGQSGNPAGKRKGTRHRVTVLAERLMADDTEAIVLSVLE